MKLSLFTSLSLIAVAAGFAPTSVQKASTALNAEVDQSRKAFFSAAAATVFGAAVAGPAMAMDQVLVTDPTEQWETGKPTPAAAKARADRFKNARTARNSNFAPIKRLTVERKSPVVSFLIGSSLFVYLSFVERSFSTCFSLSLNRPVLISMLPVLKLTRALTLDSSNRHNILC